jgi:hypothetical protein
MRYAAPAVPARASTVYAAMITRTDGPYPSVNVCVVSVYFVAATRIR